MRSWIAYYYAEKDPSFTQWIDADHILHCLDYIRMSVMCHADTALEGSDPMSIARGDRAVCEISSRLRHLERRANSGEIIQGTSGLGSTHVCKNWDDVMSWTDEHEAKVLVALAANVTTNM